ncbi:MAG: metalloregulator ArsR/SmtB family transcription factor [Pseudomonadota bacterium]
MEKPDGTDADRGTDCGCSTASSRSEAADMALQLKALAHPVRLQIMELLRCKEHKCCGDICSCLPQAQSTISQHLDLLCRAGLVTCEPDGTRSNYSLNTSTIAGLALKVANLSRIGSGKAKNKKLESA